MLWWIRENKIIFPKPFIAIAAFCLLMILSSIFVCLSYTQISLMPPGISFIVQESLGQLPASRQWWQTGFPYSLMAFTVALTLANFMGAVLLLAVFNLFRNNSGIYGTVSSSLIASTVLSVMYGIAQAKGYVPAFTLFGRFESTFQSQGSYGIFVGMTCVFFFSRLFLARGNVLVNLGLFLIALSGLFINKSRTAS
jgi:hypothetical protein